MIENYETDDFERTLKEHADRFTLIPSERVWQSIYNDLHPGSKWPSLTAGLFILVILIWMGNLNRSVTDVNNATHNTEHTQSLTLNQKTESFENGSPDKTMPSVSSNKNASDYTTTSIIADSVTDQIAESSTPDITTPEHFPSPVSAHDINEYNADVVVETPAAMKQRLSHRLSNEVLPEPIANAREDASVTNKSARRTLDIRSGIRQKLKWEFFINPMISNVHFGGANLNKTASSVVYTPVSNHNMDIAKKLGFMSGMRAYYPLSRKVSLVTGAQVIYSGYNIYSEVKMPNIASLTFKDSKGKLFSKNYVSYYANENKGGTKNITNYNWQLSVPVGVKYDFYTNGQIQLSVVSTVEPFVVLGSKAYLLSGDASSYVTDPDLVRRFNLSGNIGTLISFSSDNTQWKIGPNVRYQVLSTYDNIYPVREHFISYGIHVGVSKK